VESRLVVRSGGAGGAPRPDARRALPPLWRPGWTLLVQGLDLHVAGRAGAAGAFRFVPEARLDDLMISWASDGGGVGPHIDAYDVFLIQVHGRRRWRVGRVADPRWVDGLPLKILRHFEPSSSGCWNPATCCTCRRAGATTAWPRGECMTCSVGFRCRATCCSRLADEDADSGALYRDPQQPATETPAAIPPALLDFARQSLARRLAQPLWLERRWARA
jgi:50S ribosomal protein L16 3-hydroxylase